MLHIKYYVRIAIAGGILSEFRQEAQHLSIAVDRARRLTLLHQISTMQRRSLAIAIRSELEISVPF